MSPPVEHLIPFELGLRHTEPCLSPLQVSNAPDDPRYVEGIWTELLFTARRVVVVSQQDFVNQPSPAARAPRAGLQRLRAEATHAKVNTGQVNEVRD